MTDTQSRTLRDWPLLTLQTAVAMVLSFIVYVVVFIVAGVVMYVLDRIFNEVGATLARFSSQIMATVVAIVASRAACDGVLKHYSSKSICVMFCGLSAVAAVVGVVNAPIGWRTLSDVIVLAVTGVAAFHVFWKRMDLT